MIHSRHARDSLILADNIMYLDAKAPDQMSGSAKNVIMLDNFRWKKQVGGLVKLPEAA